MASLPCPLDPSVISHLTTPMDYHHLEVIEEHILTSSCLHPPALKDLRFEESLQGCSPLLLACHFGELASVKHIVEIWGADIRDDDVYFTDSTSTSNWNSVRIGRATPLFVASINGHSNIVRYLIEKGADVSVKASHVKEKYYDGLTPLYACLSPIYRTRQEQSLPEINMNERSVIVRLLLESGADASSPSARPANGWPIWMMPLCGIDVITELVNHGIDLNQGITPSENGTILHYWAGGSQDISTEVDHSLGVVKLLLDKSVHLLAHQDDWGFTAIIEAAYGRDGKHANYAVLDYLLERDDIDEMDKIDALELAGAVALNGNEEDRSKAFKYWRQALRLRQNESKPKTLLVVKNVRTIEWVTSVELDHIILNPPEFEIQSFLVRLRILLSRKNSWKAVESLFQLYSREVCFFRLKAQKRYGDILDILWAMLETIDGLKEDGLKWMTVKIVTLLAKMLSMLELATPGVWNIESIKTSLDLVLPHFHDWERFNTQDYMENMLNLSVLLSGQHQMRDEGKLESFFQLVRRERRDDEGRNLLFMVCEDDKNIHLYATVRLLLEGEADPQLANLDGDTPLHVAASKRGELGDSIVRLLLNSGAHLDQVNKYGKTAVQIWIRKNGRKRRHNEDQGNGHLMPDWCRGIVLKLSCLCAQVIRSHNIPFMTVPVTLLPFVKLH